MSTARRTRDPERTKANILKVARQEFSDRGLHGARLDSIAARTRTTKRMIYYYFGGGTARNSAKDQLYSAVLDQAIQELNAAETALDLESLPPRDAIRRVVGFYFDYYRSQSGFTRLQITENIYGARHIRRSKRIKSLRPPMPEKLQRVLQRGLTSGDFRTTPDPVDLALLISGQCFFRVTHQPVLDAVYERATTSAEAIAQLKQQLGDVVLAYLSA